MLMLKFFRYILLVFKISWKANGAYTLLFLGEQIYENTIFPFIQIFLLARLLDLFTQNKNLEVHDLSGIILIYIGASILRRVLKTITLIYDRICNYRFHDYLRIQFNQKLITLDPATFESAEFQNLLAQMDTVRENMFDFLLGLVNLVDSLIKLIIAAVVLWVVFPYLIPVILISSLPLINSLNNFRFSILPFMMERRSSVRRILDYVKGLLSLDSASKEISIFKNGNELNSKVEEHHKHYLLNFRKTVDRNFRPLLLSDLFHLSILLGSQAFNLFLMISQKITIGQFSLYFQQLLNLSNGVSSALNQYSFLKVRFKYLDRYLEFMDHPRFIENPEQVIEIPPIPNPSVIEFRNVTFKYPNTEREILKNFDLVINSKEKVALVGENGAGKTTIIKLLLRFYDVDQGEVLVNGVNIKDINLDEWYRKMGVLFQDFIKYQFTFKDNVYFGDLDKKGDQEALKMAIHKSGAEGFLDDLPKNLDQVVGKMFEDGVDLSGGQWQKLALARAFFRDAPILILDEPTSSIDAKAEAEIFEKVQRLQKDKTVLIISHRFSTVRNADRILVLEDGKIIEEGSHARLMKQKGVYAELFELQAQGYK